MTTSQKMGIWKKQDEYITRKLMILRTTVKVVDNLDFQEFLQVIQISRARFYKLLEDPTTMKLSEYRSISTAMERYHTEFTLKEIAI